MANPSAFAKAKGSARPFAPTLNNGTNDVNAEKIYFILTNLCLRTSNLFYYDVCLPSNAMNGEHLHLYILL